MWKFDAQQPSQASFQLIWPFQWEAWTKLLLWWSFHFFSTEVNMGATWHLYSFAVLPEKALGQKWTMGSSPGVSQQVMLISKADSERPSPPSSSTARTRLAGRCLHTSHAPTPWHRRAAAEQGILGQRGRGKKSNEVFKTTHHPLLVCLLWCRGFTIFPSVVLGPHSGMRITCAFKFRFLCCTSDLLNESKSLTSGPANLFSLNFLSSRPQVIFMQKKTWGSLF